MILEAPIHHIGIATKNIKNELCHFKKIGFVEEDYFIDEMQGVRGCFLVPKNTAYPCYRIEIVENITEKGPLSNYLKQGCKMYHIAYQTSNIETDLAMLTENGLYTRQGGGG